MKKLPRTLGMVINLLVACTLGGCTYNNLCADEMDCRDGNDADYDACIIGYEASDDKASLYGCSDLWNEWVDCSAEFAHCESSDVWTDEGKCGDEWDDYRDCMN